MTYTLILRDGTRIPIEPLPGEHWGNYSERAFDALKPHNGASLWRNDPDGKSRKLAEMSRGRLGLKRVMESEAA